jgi:hypothetical protein
LRGALKNTDPVPAGTKDSGTKDSGTKDSGTKDSGTKDSGTKEAAPSLATADIGSAADEQLSEAADVLRGLALVSGRAG